MGKTYSTKMFTSCTAVVALLVLVSLVQAVNLPTPPMGWSTWESFAKRLNESVILQNLDILESTGLKNKGYTILQIDDGWQKMNRATGWISREGYDSIPNNKLGPGGLPGFASDRPPGCIIPDPEKFPNGMKALGDIAKSRGFKFGLYTSGENFVCDAVKNFRGFYASSSYANLRSIDAKCFLDWGVQLMKIDSCKPPTQNENHARTVINAWRRLLGPEVVIYNSRYGCLAKTPCGKFAGIYRCPFNIKYKQNHKVAAYCKNSADLARLGRDMKPNWRSFMSGIASRIGRGKTSKPGFWSDPDYLLPHATEVSFIQARTQFSAWCITSSPLIVSVDLRQSSQQIIDMLGNEDAIRVNQAYYNEGGDLWRMDGSIWSFTKRLSANEVALLAFHAGAAYAPTKTNYRGLSKKPKTNNLVNFKIKNLGRFKKKVTRCRYKNIWTGEEGYLDKNTTFSLTLHDCVFLIVSDCE